MAKRPVSSRKQARKRRQPPPKLAASKLPPHPSPRDPAHEEWKIDEADDESFPASDPSASAQPHRRKKA
jgi:hypothetical protein